MKKGGYSLRLKQKLNKNKSKKNKSKTKTRSNSRSKTLNNLKYSPSRYIMNRGILI